MDDLSRFAIHTATTRPWPIEAAIAEYAASGVKGVTVWRDALDGRDAGRIGGRIRDLGMAVASLCRGGFFAAETESARAGALDENRRCIDQAAALGAPVVVLVCGAHPGQDLEVSRRQIEDALFALAPHAQAAGVRLAVEPLHPMYADSRSAISTMGQARTICERIDSPWVGIAVDVYHTWWDDRLESEIGLCGRSSRLFAFHVSDWMTPTSDLLEDRGLMGGGCIPIRRIRGWMEEAGFRGFVEVEIFSRRHWASDQGQFLAAIRKAFIEHV
jgi:sugar phosphate isomerase/epimerase